jgi:hypothetical protein
MAGLLEGRHALVESMPPVDTEMIREAIGTGQALIVDGGLLAQSPEHFLV